MRVSKIGIEVKTRDIKRLEKISEECLEVAETHPYIAVDINIRVDDEISFLCKLQKILRCLQRRLPRHFQKKDNKQSFQAYSDKK